MKLSYFHVAEDVPRGLQPESAVVIDVLRASTTISCALHHGAEAVQTFADLDELKRVSALWPEDSRLLLGERGGKRLEGFDLGNSPVLVKPELVAGKRLFMSTTNGTKSLHRVREAKNLYVLSLPNRRAIADRLMSDNPKEIVVLGSGWEGSYSLEDSLAAGSLAALLLSEVPESLVIGNDELHASLALWEKWKDDIEMCLRTASHGQRLIGLGNHDKDFSCCSELDLLSVVPMQTEKGVLCAG